MANSNRVSDAVAHAAGSDRSGRLLRVDPSLPRTLVEAMLSAAAPGASGSAGTAERARPQLPRRLPAAIAAEMPPNVLYRRYPLVTSLLVELDELRSPGATLRRGR